jgi:hypothetical protein
MVNRRSGGWVVLLAATDWRGAAESRPQRGST